MISIAGDIAPAMLRRLALLHGFATVPPNQTATVLMTLRASDRELERTLAAGGRGYVEIESDLGVPAESLTRLADPARLHVSMATASCFSMAVAPILAKVSVGRGWLGGPRQTDLEMCLHEAVSNAVVHGNLGIRNGPGGARDAFENFHREVHSRLAVRDYARRRVAIDLGMEPEGLLVSVTDEGDGYQPSITVAAADAKSGRGLLIMRQLADSVEVCDGGRRILILFKP